MSSAYVVDCTVHYRLQRTTLNFLKKIKSPDPLIDAKLNSKTHIKYVFRFFEPFYARLTSKFAKSANMTQKIIFSNYFNMGIKKRRI